MENRDVMPLPPAVSGALLRLHGAGYETYVVGGCVRDFLRGVTPHDFDMATAAKPADVMRVFSDTRVVPTGIAHGTVTVIFGGMPLEITTFRIDGDYTDCRHPSEVKFTDQFRADCARRDFTVNAMGYSPVVGLVDFFGGRADLQAGQIRAVGDPDRRFGEDALRILRALRFAAELSFGVEDGTAAAVHRSIGLLSHVAHERVYTEVVKMLCGDNVEEVLTAFPDVLTQVFPELAAAVGFPQNNRHHCYDVYRHIVRTVAETPPLPALRLAALLHDAGKPAVYTEDENAEGHFYGHAAVSAELAETALRRLRADSDTLRRVVSLVTHHDEWIEVTPAAVRRYLSRHGQDFFTDMLALKRADNMAQAPAYRDRQASYDQLEEIATRILSEKPCLSLRDLAVNGEDVMRCGVPQGPSVGHTLAALHDAVLAGSLPNERGALLAALTSLAERNQ